MSNPIVRMVLVRTVVAPTTGSDGSEAHCVEATVSGGGLDDTASSGLADDTTG